MTSELAHLRRHTAQHGENAGPGPIGPSANRSRAASAGSPLTKRASVGGLLVPASMTRTHSLGDRRSQSGCALADDRRWGISLRELARRSLITQKDKKE
jgi:hypothetical protein